MRCTLHARDRTPAKPKVCLDCSAPLARATRKRCPPCAVKQISRCKMQRTRQVRAVKARACRSCGLDIRGTAPAVRYCGTCARLSMQQPEPKVRTCLDCPAIAPGVRQLRCKACTRERERLASNERARVRRVAARLAAPSVPIVAKRPERVPIVAKRPERVPIVAKPVMVPIVAKPVMVPIVAKRPERVDKVPSLDPYAPLPRCRRCGGTGLCAAGTCGNPVNNDGVYLGVIPSRRMDLVDRSPVLLTGLVGGWFLHEGRRDRL